MLLVPRLTPLARRGPVTRQAHTRGNARDRSGTVEAVIARNNEHIADFEMFFQVAQPPIDVLQRRHGIPQIGAHDRQVGVNQTPRRLAEHADDFIHDGRV